MSKTFDSATYNGTEVYVGDGIGSTSFHLMIRDVGATVGKAGIYLPTSEAPALALAILEAAGYESANTGGVITGARQAVSALEKHIEIEARHAAEAEAQAELEAEALKLLLAFQAIDEPDNRGCEWRQYGTNTKDKWLAVARKAREIGAKK